MMLIFLTCNHKKNFKDYKKVIDQVLGYAQNILPKTKISQGLFWALLIKE